MTAITYDFGNGWVLDLPLTLGETLRMTYDLPGLLLEKAAAAFNAEKGGFPSAIYLQPLGLKKANMLIALDPEWLKAIVADNKRFPVPQTSRNMNELIGGLQYYGMTTTAEDGAYPERKSEKALISRGFNHLYSLESITEMYDEIFVILKKGTHSARKEIARVFANWFTKTYFGESVKHSRILLIAIENLLGNILQYGMAKSGEGLIYQLLKLITLPIHLSAKVSKLLVSRAVDFAIKHPEKSGILGYLVGKGWTRERLIGEGLAIFEGLLDTQARLVLSIIISLIQNPNIRPSTKKEFEAFMNAVGTMKPAAALTVRENNSLEMMGGHRVEPGTSIGLFFLAGSRLALNQPLVGEVSIPEVYQMFREDAPGTKDAKGFMWGAPGHKQCVGQVVAEPTVMYLLEYMHKRGYVVEGEISNVRYTGTLTGGLDAKGRIQAVQPPIAA